MQKSTQRNIDERYSFMVDEIVRTENIPKTVLSASLNDFKKEFMRKWKICASNESRFLSKNELWLTGIVKVKVPTPACPKPGRPKKNFSECSAQSKRKRVADLCANYSAEELTFAAQLKNREEGQNALANVIKQASKTSTAAEEVWTKIKAKNDPVQIATATEALSLFTKATEKTYPKNEAIKITEVSAEVSVQALLNHTTERLIESLEPVIKECTDHERSNLELICKWGSDGTHQTQYKQTFKDRESVKETGDKFIYQSCMVPGGSNEENPLYSFKKNAAFLDAFKDIIVFIAAQNAMDATIDKRAPLVKSKIRYFEEMYAKTKKGLEAPSGVSGAIRKNLVPLTRAGLPGPEVCIRGPGF
ncbi:hypothetical protein DMENIID0001_112060 [Sergentomyia squamirostris]